MLIGCMNENDESEGRRGNSTLMGTQLIADQEVQRPNPDTNDVRFTLLNVRSGSITKS